MEDTTPYLTEIVLAIITTIVAPILIVMVKRYMARIDQRIEERALHAVADADRSYYEGERKASEALRDRLEADAERARLRAEEGWKAYDTIRSELTALQVNEVDCEVRLAKLRSEYEEALKNSKSELQLLRQRLTLLETNDVELRNRIQQLEAILASRGIPDGP